MSVERLNMAEIAIIEKKAGLSISKLFNFTEPNAVLVTATAWVIKLREDSKIDYDEFAKSVSLDDCFAIITPEEDEEEKK